ncbi:sensor histidine kinase [Actinospica sp. MGRD01-02]|uniref:Sensor histidine kinase n=1 Tax=Actinospica acidithermotolerans TaxID=2828514 RepID=A0A941E7K7_9ACTN|nr:ATP-binding protein [Actinospica acidithermotolerans]MBR7827810.1 sensor histidine kinase [Actinospica acidithermotolerans]
MHGNTHATKGRTLTKHDDPASIAAWVKRTAVVLDSRLPSVTVIRAGQVAEALVDNAQRHGAPPVKIEISVSAFVTIEVTDHGPALPAASTDGTGSLARIVDAFATLWDVVQHDDDSKTVSAMISTGPADTIPQGQQRSETSRSLAGEKERR